MTKKVWKCSRGHIVERKGQRAERRDHHGESTPFLYCATCKAVKPVYCEKAGRIKGRYEVPAKRRGVPA